MGLISNIEHRYGTVLASISYQYDANNNRTQQIETNGRGDEQTDYDFDANDRLLSISYPDVPSGEGNDVTYSYDDNGNQTQKVQGTANPSTTNYDLRNHMSAVTQNGQTL